MLLPIRSWLKHSDTSNRFSISVVILMAVLFSSLRCIQAFSSFRHRRRPQATHLFSQAIYSTRIEDVTQASTRALPLKLPLQTTGSNPIQSVVAPMVAASDFAFRCLCRQYNQDTNLLCFSQMLHAKNMVGDEIFRRDHCDFYETLPVEINKGPEEHLPPLVNPSQARFLGGLSRYDPESLPTKSWIDYTQGQLVVQVAGDNVDKVVEASQWIIQEYATTSSDSGVVGIDLNCGCPQQIARKGNYGAFLMEADNGIQAASILSALRKKLPAHIAVSTKCRLPLEASKLMERVQRLEGAGIDFLTVHGRTLKENKTLTGPAKVAALSKVVQQASNIPIIVNGGVENHLDVERLLEKTGASAVMSSEGLLERPDVFQRTRYDTSSPRKLLEHQFSIARNYLAWCRLYPPLPGVLGQKFGTFNIVKGHLFKFLHRYWQDHIDLRDALARPDRKLGTLEEANELVDALYDRYQNMDDEALQKLPSAKPNASWYRRHWDANGVTSTTSPALRANSDSVDMLVLSVEDRKKIMQDRIAKLQAERKQKKADEGKTLSRFI